MGEVLLHLGFLLVFSGFVLGSGFGDRTQGIQVVEGETATGMPEISQLPADCFASSPENEIGASRRWPRHARFCRTSSSST